MIPTCKSCKYCFDPLLTPLPTFWNGPLCFSPDRTEITPVYGQKGVVITCAAARANTEDCGPDAFGYEPSLRTRLVYFLRSVLGARR